MADIMELEVKGFDDLLDKMTIKLPQRIREMAYDTTGKVAAIGRKKELVHANNLHFGYVQRKSKGKTKVVRQFTRWDSKVGWVSTTRQSGDGKSGFRMAQFSWERAKKTSAEADYSNIAANAWSKATKPYEKNSPYVGREGTRYVRWKKGEARTAVHYRWSVVYSMIASAVPQAIAVVERKYDKEFKKL